MFFCLDENSLNDPVKDKEKSIIESENMELNISVNEGNIDEPINLDSHKDKSDSTTGKQSPIEKTIHLTDVNDEEDFTIVKRKMSSIVANTEPKNESKKCTMRKKVVKKKEKPITEMQGIIR